MKEKIYTIPVTDAFKSDSECPFCFMKEELEKDAIDFVLGPSYMEVDVRGETNKLGFCKEHFDKLYSQKNVLGLALMLQSHMDVVKEQLKEMAKASNKKKGKSKGLFNKVPKETSPIYDYTSDLEHTCYICNKVDSTFQKYLSTFFYLWKKAESFQELVNTSKGFCIHHYGLLLNRSSDYLNSDVLVHFNETITSLQLKHLDRVTEDLDWFIKKFDYKFHKEPWKNAKDAVPRTLKKIGSLDV